MKKRTLYSVLFLCPVLSGPDTGGGRRRGAPAGSMLAVKDAVDSARKEGKKVGMFRPVTVWPFPDEQLLQAAQAAKRVLVVEHNDGQMLKEAERVIAGRCPVSFLGKVNGTVILPDEILKNLAD